jgi:D12 class N6 adenine-specific DNA methyltransferase
LSKREENMLPPVTYQGGKGRLAKQIVQKMAVPAEATFYDLCCGSGAVSLALVETGHSPERIIMVDKGPWGKFWKAIGEGTFDLAVFQSYCDILSGDPKSIKPVLEKCFSTLASWCDWWGGYIAAHVSMGAEFWF